MKYSFNVEDAARYGVKCAVLLAFIRERGGQIKLGLAEIRDALPFLTQKQVFHGLKTLVDNRVISCHNTRPVTYKLKE